MRDSVVGPRARVAAGARVLRSVLLAGAQVGGTLVEDRVVGEEGVVW